MYFGASERGTDSLEVKGEGTADAEGDHSVSGSCDRRWCAASREGQVLREDCLGRSSVSIFLAQGVIVLVSLVKDSFSGCAAVG